MCNPLPGRARPAHRAGREPGATDDPIIRQRLAWCYGKVESCATSAAHADAVPRRPPPRARRRASPSSTGASTTSVVTELAVDILGADALVPTGRAPVVGVPDRRRRARRTPRARGSTTFLNARAGTIYAGTVPDPAQHPRRDGPRPAQGAEGRRRHLGRVVEGQGLSSAGGMRAPAVAASAWPGPAVADRGPAGLPARPRGMVAAPPFLPSPRRPTSLPHQPSTATPGHGRS